MKQILGDNQFFGVNHNDLDKANLTKDKFTSNKTIIEFIEDSIEIGLDGFMINSNTRGYEIAAILSKTSSSEIHYSIPYPHKFATIVNEDGMFNLLKYVLYKSSFKSLFLHIPRFLFTRNVRFLLPLVLDLEIPSNLSKGSYVYLQNIVTDLFLGFKRYDLLESFCNSIIRKGYFPGFISLNPILLDRVISSFNSQLQSKIIVCFNINNTGFNVFPSLQEVETLVKKKSLYKKMGMSILSSGATHDVEKSLKYVRSLNLDYVVYGSSSIDNVKKNYNILT